MTRPLDASAYWDDVHLLDPDRTYVVATLPRTGSTWLCDSLRDTRRLGVPFEYFNPVTLGGFSDRIGVPRPRPRARLAQWQRRMHKLAPGKQLTTWRTPASMRSYVRWLASHRTSGNGTFGTKLHKDEHDRIRISTGLDVFDLLRPKRVVWMRRRDHVRQAISLHRARATRVWHSTDGASDRPDPPFDPDAIHATVAELRAHDEAWAHDLGSRGLPVHQVWYEDLVDDREVVLSACFAFLGAPGAAVPPSALQRRADEVTEEWVARLQAAR